MMPSRVEVESRLALAHIEGTIRGLLIHNSELLSPFARRRLEVAREFLEEYHARVRAIRAEESNHA